MSFSDYTLNHRSIASPGMYSSLSTPAPSLPPVGEGDGKPHDWASSLTLGMFSLVHAQSQRPVHEQISSSFWRKVKRKGLTAGADYFTGSDFGRGFHQELVKEKVIDPKKWADLSRKYDQYSYSGMFGIGRNLASNYDAAGRLIPMDKLTGIQAEKGVANLANWKRAIADNFDITKNKALNGPLNLNAKNFMNYTVSGNMLRRISKFLATGKGAFEAGLYSVSLGFLAANIGVVAKKQWDESKANGDGLLMSVLKTGVASVKEAVKSIASFEIGGMAYTVGFALLSFNPVMAFAGGMLAAAAAQTFSYKLLNDTVGDSIQYANKDPMTQA